MHTTAAILAKLVVNAGLAVVDPNLATALKWQINVHVVSDAPDRILTAYDTLGLKDGRIVEPTLNRQGQPTYKTVEHPGWQIMARSLYSKTAYAALKTISDYFDTVHNAVVTMQAETVDGLLIPTMNYQISGLFKTSPIMNSGQDEKRRFLFTLNGTTTIREL